MRLGERTPCPHCGRATPTASDGVCVECWKRKTTPAVFYERPLPVPARQRGTIIDDLLYGLLDVDDLLDDLLDPFQW